MRGVLTLAVLSAMLLVAFQPAHAQTETPLYDFCSVPNCVDGFLPASSLTPVGGNFYGTTFGGISNTGACAGCTVFELSPNGVGGYNESVLYSFCPVPNCTDGSEPYSNVIFDSVGGNLYGTTYSGGLHNSGTVFELSPEPGGGCPSGSNTGNGWCETVLYSFTDTSGDGANPEGGLIMDSSGNLYGTTLSGGTGVGTVYELSPNGSGGWNEQVIYGAGSGAGLAIDSSGNLYGADQVSAGHVFKLSPNGSGGWNATILYTFPSSGAKGKGPSTPVLDSAGNIYGTAASGGYKYDGTVWKLTLVTTGKNKGTYTQRTLHTFTAGKDGAYPLAGVVLDASGNIYGTTEQGGKYNGGTVFELALSGTTYREKILWPFNLTDGYQPFASLILDGGNLYGTTYGGGPTGFTCSGGCGVAFEIIP